MPRHRIPATLLLASVCLLAGLGDTTRRAGEREDGEGGLEAAEHAPCDLFYAQRANPDGTLPMAKWEAARQQVVFERSLALGTSAGPYAWQPVGPYNIGGRVTAIAVAPDGTLYLGAANGGVWKSVNGGVNWTSLTDAQSFVSVGALAIDPGNANTIYCGTGESNASADSYDGDGLWRSSDGGSTWAHLGLDDSGRIGAVVVDPANSSHLLVAAQGHLFSTGPDRGLYQTFDGGASWSQVLYVNDSTGVSDIVMNPVHPDTVYAATWTLIRRNTYRRASGPGTGIWRSIDRGTTWTRLVNGLPTPTDSVGRIALAVAPSRPSTVYAQIGTGVNQGYVGFGFYRSQDGGDSWVRRDLGSTFTNAFGGFCWYFGAMGVDPQNADLVYAMGVTLLRSPDGGASWGSANGSLHPDQHAIWIDPANSNHIYEGNDGGFWWTTDGGTWTATADLPISQFYDGAVDATNAANVYGGTQDNYTLKTSSGPSSWFPILGGDGFHVLVDPVNPSVVLMEYQNCCSNSGFQRSQTGGASYASTSGWNSTDRFGWDTPIAMNPRNHNLLIAGSQYVYRSTNNGISWSKPSSQNLSTNPVSQLVYGCCTTLAISNADTNVYYAGTDDAKVWRSSNRGASWTDISAGLPGRWVTRVVPDPADPQVVYVTESGFSSDVQSALVYRSANQGASWTNISANLPNFPANALVVDPANTQVLYLGTDFGAWYSPNAGAGWTELAAGSMPYQPIFDLVLRASSRQLFAFTHGRSAWKLDLSTVPTAAPLAALPARFELSAPWPNPARGDVRLSLETTRAGRAEVAIYDVVGRRVSTLLEGAIGVGRHDLTWDRRGVGGRRAASGVYFVRAEAGGERRTRRVVLAD